MTEKEIWIVWTNTDLAEGRGSQYALYCCETRGTAERLAKGMGVQGCDADVRKSIRLEYKGAYYTPAGFIYPPTAEDKRREEELAQLEAKRTFVEQAVLKAVKLGMTAEEVNAILEFRD